jgi:predicted helicase
MLIVHKINALEPAVKTSELLLGEFITREANEAAEVKREKPILVVLGNPPYSGHSANRSYVEVSETIGGRTRKRKQPTWIGKLLEDYKQVDGQPLEEKNPKWLQDDYVKFIRFAEWRIEQTGQGVVAFITNHAYLTGNRNQKGTALYIPKLGVQYRLSLNVEGGCTQCGMSHRISE